MESGLKISKLIVLCCTGCQFPLEASFGLPPMGGMVLFCPQCKKTDTPQYVSESIHCCNHCEKPLTVLEREYGVRYTLCFTKGCGDAFSSQDKTCIGPYPEIESNPVAVISSGKVVEKQEAEWALLEELKYSSVEMELLDHYRKTNEHFVDDKKDEGIFVHATLRMLVAENYKKILDTSSSPLGFCEMRDIRLVIKASPKAINEAIDEFIQSSPVEARYFVKGEGQNRKIYKGAWGAIFGGGRFAIPLITTTGRKISKKPTLDQVDGNFS